jgi:hypothetical protein
MGVDPNTKQASLIVMASFSGKLGHWAQHHTEALYNLNSVSQLTDFVRSSFVIKDYQVEHLQHLVRIEQSNLDISEYTRKFNDSHSFWKSDISEKFSVYLFILGLRSGQLRAELMSGYGLNKFKSLSELQLHAARSNLVRLPPIQRTESPQRPALGGKSEGARKHFSKNSSRPQNKPVKPYSSDTGPSRGASGSGGSTLGNSAQGQKRKLAPHEQKKKDSWLKAKAKLSSAEFQQRLKTGSCINCGEQGHIFDACTKPKPS